MKKTTGTGEKAADIDALKKKIAQLGRERGIGGSGGVDFPFAEPARMLLNASDDLAFIIDAAGKIQAINDVGVRWFGKSREEMVGEFAYDFVPPNLAFSRGEIFHEVLRTGEPRRFEDENRGRVFDNIIHPIFDERNIPIGVAVFARDITDRKRAEREIREQARFSQILLDSFPCVALLMRPKTREIIAMNRAAKEVGCRLGETCFGTWPRFEAPCPWCLAPKLWSEGTAQQEEFEGLGIIWDAHWIPVSDDLYLHYAFDITERKRAEKTLRESEERFRDITFSMADWVWEVDKNGVYTYSSQKAFDLLGRSSEEIIGKTPFDFMPPDEAERMTAIFFEIAANKAPIKDLENWNVTKNGRKICLLTNGVPVLDERGNLKAYRGVDKDITDRNLAEEALRKSEEQFHCIFEQSPVAIEIYDEKGRLVDANPVCLKTFGVAELKHVLGFDLFADPNIPADAKHRLACGEAVKFESVFDFDVVREKNLYPTTRSGVCNIDCVILPLRDAGNRSTGYLVHVRDITGRKQGMKALYASEEKFQKAFHSSPIALGITGLNDGKFLEANESLTRVLGFSIEETIGYTTLEMNIWRNPEDRSRYISNLKRDGFVRNAEVAVRTKSGESVTVLMSSELIDIAGQACMLSTFYDITDRKRAEEALRESIEKFRLLAEYTPDWEYWHDTEGRFIYVSPAVEHITGYLPEEFYSDSGMLDRIIFRDDTALVKDRIDKALAEDAPLEMEFRIRRKDGDVAWIGHRCIVIWGPDGEKLGRRASNRDITERKRIEEERKELERQFLQAQKMEMVGRLAGGIAHDFNNLLTIITGNAELALMSLSPDVPANDTINEIRKAAERAANLTRQLLAFSRKEFAEPRVLDLNAVIGEMGKLLRRLIGEHIDLVCEQGPELKKVRIDPGQIEQVITNLAVNARDAMPEGGRLSISTSNVKVDEERTRMRPDLVPGEYVRVTVTDTGIGMSGEVMEHLFEPFFTTKEVGKGTGLGLSTCYGIVKQNRGTIEAESEPGRGAAFRVYFPTVDMEETAAGERAEAPVRRGSETVLVAEDEDSVRNMVAGILRGNGYFVIEASDGENALEKAAAHTDPIDALLSDIVMPGMGGRDLARWLREIRPGIRTLFMSGYTDDTALRDGVFEEGTAFIRKPFSPMELLRKIEELFGGAKE